MDPKQTNVVSFPFQPVVTPRDPEPPLNPEQLAATKMGLYALGTQDVVMSLPLFQTILSALQEGTMDERTQLATHLREMFNAHFPPR